MPVVSISKQFRHPMRGDKVSPEEDCESNTLITDAHPEIATHHPRPIPLFLFALHPETGEWLWESATEFCDALDRCAGRAMQSKRTNY